MSRKKRLWWGGVLVILQLFIILGLILTETKTPITPVKEADAQCQTFWLATGDNAVPVCAGGSLLGYVYSGQVPVYGGTATRYIGLCARII
ncbi:MAG: hypothetical protein WC450_02740 [Candidatus Omnitrophota bacterium]|jgi:hypothetical protein